VTEWITSACMGVMIEAEGIALEWQNLEQEHIYRETRMGQQ